MARPKSENMKQRILDIAAERFYKIGFHKVSLDSLVAELRTSKSSIYKYFDSKEDIVRELIININYEININIKSIIESDELSYNEKFEEITKFTGNILSRVGEEFLNDLKIHTPEIWNDYLELRRERLENLYGKFIKDGINSGILRKDINEKFLLIIYTKLTEIVVKPSEFQDLPISNKDAYNFITSIFLEGSLSKKR